MQHQAIQGQQEVVHVLQQVLARLEGIDARLEGVEARLANMRRRAANHYHYAKGALQPLCRELQQAPAGGHAPGDLPQAGVFPADSAELMAVGARPPLHWQPSGAALAACLGLARVDAVPTPCRTQLTHAQLDALEAFYGHQFPGNTGARSGLAAQWAPGLVQLRRGRRAWWGVLLTVLPARARRAPQWPRGARR